jgi:hypothetical protein
MAAATTRLRTYLDRADSAIADEPATARALADFLLRALHCGAASAEELHAAAGVDAAQLAELARPRR